MRVSKSQRREHNYTQARRLESRPPEIDMMSSSTERKEAPESRILSFLQRFRNGWGIVLLALLLSFYLTGFYHHAASTEPPWNTPQDSEEPPPKEPLPMKSYLLVSTSTDYQEALPGAVNSEETSFEANAAEKGRDANTLPGAIGLDGAFDEHGGDNILPGAPKNDSNQTVTRAPVSAPAAANSTGTKQGADSDAVDSKSEASSLTKEAESKDMVPTGQEQGSISKKKKKKKKGRMTVSESATPLDSSEKSTAKRRRRKKQRRRKKAKKTTEKGVAAGSSSSNNAKSGESETRGAGSSLSNSGESEAKLSGPEEKTKGKGPDEDVTPSGTESKALNATSTAEQGASEHEESPPYFDGARPMDRQMEELQVPGGTGTLEEDAVKGYYGKLVKSYLAPFTKGISRKAFFSVLRRRTYSMSPPGSNKGIQTILFQLVKQKLFLMDPYEVMKNSKPFYKTRVNELIWLFSEIARGGNVPDTEFLVAIHDCVQTVNAKHTYRGAVFMESNPTFTIVSCNFSDNIPIPMWEGDPVRGGLKSWDKKMGTYKSSDKTGWSEKKEQAVFRGGNRPSMFFKQKADADKRCDDAGRSRLSFLGTKFPDLFDVSVSGKWCGTSHSIASLSEADHHQYKYILYAEGNCFWADRLNKQVFGPSAIVKQQTPCGQFWEPLLKPMTHYIPTDFFFQDTVDRIKWAKENDAEVQKIVKNANEFAENFLSEKAIKLYVEVLLTEYTKLLSDKVIKPEKGSREVTA